MQVHRQSQGARFCGFRVDDKFRCGQYLVRIRFPESLNVIGTTNWEKSCSAMAQDSGGFVGALDGRGVKHDVRDGPGSDVFRQGAIWACGLFAKMPRRRQGMQQPMYLTISNQGARVV